MILRQEAERNEEEHIAYSRINALIGDFLCLYIVDPVSGYYHNYRLSCAKCNRPSKPCGKKDYFPIKKGTPYAVYPNSDDDNILLDPCKKEDCELIDCDNTGAIIANTKDRYERFRVEVSERIYNLNIFYCG